jgi:hypothetical protein
MWQAVLEKQSKGHAVRPQVTAKSFTAKAVAAGKRRPRERGPVINVALVFSNVLRLASFFIC